MGEGTQTIDLDALKAARLEAAGQGPVIRFGGVDYQLPTEMPFAAVELVGSLVGSPEEVAAAVSTVVGALIGPDRVGEFMAARPSLDDVKALVEAALAGYGLTVPEQPASES